MIRSFSLNPAKGYSALRAKVFEVEEHVREADATNAAIIPEEARTVVLMKSLSEELPTHVRIWCISNIFFIPRTWFVKDTVFGW